MSRESELFTKFITRFTHCKLVSTHKEIDKINNYIVFVLAVESESIIPVPNVENFDSAYVIFSINKFQEFKFRGLNIIDLVDTSTHILYWQIKYSE